MLYINTYSIGDLQFDADGRISETGKDGKLKLIDKERARQLFMDRHVIDSLSPEEISRLHDATKVDQTSNFIVRKMQETFDKAANDARDKQDIEFFLNNLRQPQDSISERAYEKQVRVLIEKLPVPLKREYQQKLNTIIADKLKNVQHPNAVSDSNFEMVSTKPAEPNSTSEKTTSQESDSLAAPRLNLEKTLTGPPPAKKYSAYKLSYMTTEQIQHLSPEEILINLSDLLPHQLRELTERQIRHIVDIDIYPDFPLQNPPLQKISTIIDQLSDDQQNQVSQQIASHIDLFINRKMNIPAKILERLDTATFSKIIRLISKEQAESIAQLMIERANHAMTPTQLLELLSKIKLLKENNLISPETAQNLKRAYPI